MQVHPKLVAAWDAVTTKAVANCFVKSLKYRVKARKPP